MVLLISFSLFSLCVPLSIYSLLNCSPLWLGLGSAQYHSLFSLNTQTILERIMVDYKPRSRSLMQNYTWKVVRLLYTMCFQDFDFDRTITLIFNIYVLPPMSKCCLNSIIQSISESHSTGKYIDSISN